jgi:hypothetical protein
MGNLEHSFDAPKSTGLPAVDVALFLRAAVESQGFQHQSVAGDIGYHGDYFNKVLGNVRGITLDRLGRLPLDVQRDLVGRWAAALGMAPAPGIEQLAGLADLIASRRVRVTIESR